jgi:ABC-2 type transport system permease protein
MIDGAAFGRFVLRDLRLGVRRLASMFGELPPGKLALLVALLIAVLHAAAWPVAGWLSVMEAAPGGEARIATILAGGLMLVAPWIVAQSMTELARVLFSRSDLELILSSPVDARSLLSARALTLALDAVTTVGLLVGPLADVAALRGGAHWLALYPTLIAVGLFGTGLGVMLAMGLFLAVGPRRARLVSQIAATTIGASFVLGGQAIAMAPDRMRAAVLSLLSPPAGGSRSIGTLAWAPVRAAAGDLPAITEFALLGLAVFALAAASFGESFARAAVAAPGAHETAAISGSRKLRFGAGVGATLRIKERRILWRDPWLMSQLLLQAAYTMPVAVILWRSGGPTSAVGVAFAPTLVVIAAQLAGVLSWLALSAEDAPDFLASAPVPRGAAERAKLAAIGQPIVVLLGAPLAALAFASPWAGLCAALFGSGAVASASLINLWRQAPARRGLVLRRHAQSKLVGLMEHLLSILWATAAAIAVIGSWTVVVPLVAATATLAINWKWAAMERPAPA